MIRHILILLSSVIEPSMDAAILVLESQRHHSKMSASANRLLCCVQEPYMENVSRRCKCLACSGCLPLRTGTGNSEQLH